MNNTEKIELSHTSAFKFTDFQTVRSLLKENKCIENSIACGKAWGADVVEGVVKVIEKDGNGHFFPHAWNKKDGKYFDTTKDYFLTKKHPDSIFEHYPADTFSPKTYKVNKEGKHSWKSEAKLVSDHFNALLDAK